MTTNDSLEGQLARLRAEVAELRRRVEGQHGKPDRSPPSRRDLLRTFGGAGTAAIIGGVMASSAPAAAAPTGLQSETVNGAIAPTELRYTGTGGFLGNVLFVQDGLWGTRPATERSNVMMVWSGNWATNGLLAVSNSANGNGAEARGEGPTATGLLVSGRQAAIRFAEASDVLPPPDTFKAHSRGEVQYDRNGTLWFCTDSASPAFPPGQWRKITGPGTAGAFHVLGSPVRAYSSRDSGAPKLGPNEERAVSLAAAVPEGATAVLTNITLTQTSAPAGFVAMFAADVTWPGTSNINWKGAEVDIANTAVSALDPLARIKLRGGGAPTHVIVDVFGYWR